MRAAFRVVPVLLLLLSLGLLLLPRAGSGVPLYAARTGLACQTCHFDPNGGGPRNEFGFGFAKNRHGVTPEEGDRPWGDLTLVNRAGENLPLYFGVNQRFMLLANRHTDVDRFERLGFFNMENAIHLAFQPHPRLTLVYTLDAFAQGPVSSVTGKEAFGMVGGLPGNGYLRAGRFRVPFGLRMDDHTVATRAGFGDFGTGGSFLPYDPRLPDMGLEVGMERSGWFGRASFTNGASGRAPNASPIAGANPYAEAKAVKLGYQTAHYQGGLSLYDDFRKVGGTPLVRTTRWGYYGMARYGPLALIGELDAGTDDLKTSDVRMNSLAGFVELDWSAHRAYNLRLRYDRAELNRDPDRLIRDASTFSRYAIEGEWVPVPFAELRWTYRYLDPKDPSQADERQAYLQFHFSY